MHSVLLYLCILHLVALRLESILPRLKPETLRHNVCAIGGHYVGRLLLLYQLLPIFETLAIGLPWTEHTWTSYRNCTALHIAMYLFDATYRLDIYLTIHHFIAVSLLQLPLYHRSDTLTLFVIPFWCPGIVLGDSLEDLSYLLRHGVLLSKTKTRFAAQMVTVVAWLVRGVQWGIIVGLVIPRRGEKVVAWASVALPVFLWYECKALRTMFEKAFGRVKGRAGGRMLEGRERERGRVGAR